MILTICGKEIESKEIYGITIKEREIMIDTQSDFIRLSYSTEDDIIEAKNWLKFQEITDKEIFDAASTIMLICDYYLNQYDQCTECPINRDYGCLIQSAPMNWRRHVTRTNET